MAAQQFTDLQVWQKGRAFRNEMFKLAKKFPKNEQFRLADQLIRASRSICANIAEGHGRYHFQENIQYCRMARGSLYECYDHLICAYDCEYIDRKILVNFKQEIDSIGQVLNGYIRHLKNMKKQQ